MKKYKSQKSKISTFMTALAVIFVVIITTYLAEHNAAMKAHANLTTSNAGCAIIGTALFSPDDDIQNTLIYLINNEKKKISTAIYTLTQKDVANAFINAKERGVCVEFVVDRAYGSDRFSKVALLAKNRVPVWVYQMEPTEQYNSLMHDKFCIFEDNIDSKSLLWTGSYNFTQSANLRNQENVVILENENLINRFRDQFERLKARSILISGKSTDLNNFYSESSDDYDYSNKWDKAYRMLNKLLKYIK